MKYFIALLSIASLMGCATITVTTSETATITDYSNQSLEESYQKAIEDAAIAVPDEIYTGLMRLDKENESLVWKRIDGKDHLLVASWVSDTSYYTKDPTGHYNTTDYQIWVTAVPEMTDFCETLPSMNLDELNLRLEQLLGLPPNDGKLYFVEFWVQPTSLFRPCPDNEITDSACGVCFPEGTDQSYINWFNKNRLSSFYNCGINDNFPWTQLGYTYDWKPGASKHIGLSEFIIKENQDIWLHSITATSEYCTSNNE